MPKTQTVHFTVDADFVTKFARDLRSEGEYDKAYNFLGTMSGINVVQMNRVIMGHARFEEIGNTQTFKFVKDDWKPDLNHCHLSQYPNPDVAEEMEDARESIAVRQKGARTMPVYNNDASSTPAPKRRRRNIRTLPANRMEYLLENYPPDHIHEARLATPDRAYWSKAQVLKAMEAAFNAGRRSRNG